MGDPRRLRKNYKRPTSPFEKARMESELSVLGDYGLRNKKELWKHANQLRRFRQIARDLKTMPEERKNIGSSELLGRLNRLGLVAEGSTSDDVLSLTIKEILERRLQTLVWKKGLARSIYQARQFIVHKHISVDGKIIASPSYLVKKSQEGKIEYHGFSPLKGHPEKVFGESKKADSGNADAAKKSSRSRKPSKKSSKKE